MRDASLHPNGPLGSSPDCNSLHQTIPRAMVLRGGEASMGQTSRIISPTLLRTYVLRSLVSTRQLTRGAE
jgi:hypothetical protein